MIETVVPSNKEMAAALKRTATILSELHILSPEGNGSLGGAADRLLREPEKHWACNTTKSQPITFEKRTDRSKQSFQPTIGVDRIEVRENGEELPFVKWDISLLLKFDNGTAHCPRWHFDLGNPDQEGPKTHLQYGGYKHPNNPGLGPSVREPRWNTAPMDIILLCETVSANFFHEIWERSLRRDTSWTEIVRMSQRLCYPHYLRTLYSSLNSSGSGTHLDHCWNRQ